MRRSNSSVATRVDVEPRLDTHSMPLCAWLKRTPRSAGGRHVTGSVVTPGGARGASYSRGPLNRKTSQLGPGLQSAGALGPIGRRPEIRRRTSSRRNWARSAVALRTVTALMWRFRDRRSRTLVAAGKALFRP